MYHCPGAGEIETRSASLLGVIEVTEFGSGALQRESLDEAAMRPQDDRPLLASFDD